MVNARANPFIMYTSTTDLSLIRRTCLVYKLFFFFSSRTSREGLLLIKLCVTDLAKGIRQKGFSPEFLSYSEAFSILLHSDLLVGMFRRLSHPSEMRQSSSKQSSLLRRWQGVSCPDTVE